MPLIQLLVRSAGAAVIALSIWSPLAYAGSGPTSLSGSVGGYHWTVAVHSAPQPDRVCLRVGLSPGDGSPLAGIGTICGGVDQPFPLATSSTANEGEQTRAVVGMVFPPSVVKAKVWLKDREPRSVSLRLIGKRLAQRNGLDPLRFGATAYAGASCLKRIVGYDRNGRPAGLPLKVPCG